MRFLFLSGISFFVMIVHSFVNQYTSKNGFFDIGFCFFFYFCLKMIPFQKSSWKVFYELTRLSLILGFFYDLFSLNTMGTAMLSFLIFSCFIFLCFPFIFQISSVALYFFFILSSFVYQSIACFVLIVCGDIMVSSLNGIKLLLFSFFHAGILSLFLLKR